MSLDVFKADGFSVRSLTAAINQMAYVPGRIGQLGLYRQFGITTTVAQIEVKDGVLYLVPAGVRGEPATRNRDTSRKLIPLNAVHLPVEDRILADEVQNVRDFGTESTLQSIQSKVNEKLMTIRQSFEATLEWHRLGGIKGVILDADGVTTLYDLYDVMGISKLPVVNFDMTAADPESGAIRKTCSSIIRSIEDELGAAPYSYIHCYCGPQFIDDLTSLPETIEAYQRYVTVQGATAGAGGQLRQQVARKSFDYGGILFEEYRGKVGDVQFIGDDEAHFFPVGVPGLFDCAYAPANYVETVNTNGLPFYAKQTVDPKGRWIDLDAQSNPVHYCTRPRVLIQGVGRSG